MVANKCIIYLLFVVFAVSITRPCDVHGNVIRCGWL